MGPGVALGVALAFGVERWPGATLAAADLLPVELRLRDPDHAATVDVLVDWEQLAYSQILSSSPRLGVTALLHPRVPLGGRLGGTIAPGIDVDWGTDAVVREGELRRVTAGSFGLAARAGLDWTGRRRHAWGLYLRGTWGFRSAPDGPQDWLRGLVELSSVWRLGRAP